MSFIVSSSAPLNRAMLLDSGVLCSCRGCQGLSCPPGLFCPRQANPDSTLPSSFRLKSADVCCVHGLAPPHPRTAFLYPTHNQRGGERLFLLLTSDSVSKCAWGLWKMQADILIPQLGRRSLSPQAKWSLSLNPLFAASLGINYAQT